MPIYEFICKKCREEFEELVMSPSDPKPKCPECGSKKVEKLMSAGSFRPQGIPSGSGGFSAPKCAPSGG